MRDPGNCSAVSRLYPDFMGFIFYSKSPRFVGDCFRLTDDLPPTVKKTGVFVNEVPDRILEIAVRCQLDAVQLHGDESPAVCAAVSETVPLVIKAFSVREGFNFTATRPYQGVADYFLFDSRGSHPGGNGIPFNWALLKKYDQQTPFFLSGGISPSNVHLIHTLNYPAFAGVDLNSGFEISPGIKDVNALRDAINTLNKA